MFARDSKTGSANPDPSSFRDAAGPPSEAPIPSSQTAKNDIAALKRAYMPSGIDNSLRGFRNQFGVFMPSRLEDVATILMHTCAGVGKRFADLGSGDGRVALLAALRFGMNAVGYEQSEQLIYVSRRMADTLDVAPRVEFRNTDFRHADLKHHDLVYYFDGGSLATRYEGPRERPTAFFSSLATMKEGAELVVAYSHKLHNHLSRFDCFELRHSVVTDPIFPTKIYVRNACPCPSTWEDVFPLNLDADSK